MDESATGSVNSFLLVAEEPEATRRLGHHDGSLAVVGERKPAVGRGVVKRPGADSPLTLGVQYVRWSVSGPLRAVPDGFDGEVVWGVKTTAEAATPEIQPAVKDTAFTEAPR